MIATTLPIAFGTNYVAVLNWEHVIGVSGPKVYNQRSAKSL